MHEGWTSDRGFLQEIIYTKPLREARRFGIYENSGKHTNLYTPKAPRSPGRLVQASVALGHWCIFVPPPLPTDQ